MNCSLIQTSSTIVRTQIKHKALNMRQRSHHFDWIPKQMRYFNNLIGSFRLYWAPYVIHSSKNNRKTIRCVRSQFNLTVIYACSEIGVGALCERCWPNNHSGINHIGKLTTMAIKFVSILFSAFLSIFFTVFRRNTQETYVWLGFYVSFGIFFYFWWKFEMFDSCKNIPLIRKNSQSRIQYWKCFLLELEFF